ncbi:MAG: hypothetical protein NXI30_10485 [bacterium]|nr:hypothetical protein [bacterium]
MIRSKRLGLELYPGTVFIYRSRRRGLFGFGKNSYAIGEVLAVDEPHGIVHVRTLKSNAQTGPKVDINHIPVLFRQLVRDLVEVVGKASPDIETWASINEFRRRHAAGEVGAFAGRLWKAEALARKALPPEQERTPIQHTFVKRRDGNGPLSVVEVSV